MCYNLHRKWINKYKIYQLFKEKQNKTNNDNSLISSDRKKNEIEKEGEKKTEKRPVI